MLAIVLPIVALAVGLALGWLVNERFGAKSLDAARKRADETTRAARREAEKIRHKAVLEAREEILEQRGKAERDIRSQRGQIQKRERDLKRDLDALAERETQLQQERDRIEEQRTALAGHEGVLAESRAEVERLREGVNVQLEEVSRLTREEARRQLLHNLKAETRLDAARMIKASRDEAQRTADAEATKILTLAIERLASDVSAERTVSHFELPGGTEIKGRVIGQDGKNIRAFEKATGIQLLLEEGSSTVTLSGYHPVNREVARRVLETLVKDGNIHPRRIDELTRRARRRLDDEMRRAGQDALKELGISGVHAEIIGLLGRLRFRTSYGQNVLAHSVEVAYLTGMLAVELRLDEKLARRAGLLHDVGKAIDYEREGTHPEIGAEVARRCGEPEVVVNAIASHHEDCEAISPISVLVAAADALSGARPGARRKSVAEYIKRIEKLEEIANSMHGVEQSYAVQAGREIRVIARSREVDDAKTELLAADLASRIESEMDYPGKIKVTVIRETRAVEMAR